MPTFCYNFCLSKHVMDYDEQIATIIEKESFSIFISIVSETFPKQVLGLRMARALYIAALSHQLLVHHKTITKRDVYYTFPSLFCGSQRASDRALEDLAASLLCVPRNDLNIVAAPRGLVMGSLTYRSENGEKININRFGSNGMHIPSRPERITDLQFDAKFVLIVEKECIFRQIASSHFSATYGPMLLITGRGYPNNATRTFIQLLLSSPDAKNSRFYLLTDADPHGVHIAFIYLYGSANFKRFSAFQGRTATQSRPIKWIGLFSYETIPKTGISLTDLDVKILTLLAKKNCEIQDPQIDGAISVLSVQKKKYEIESLHAISSNYLLDEYLPKHCCCVEAANGADETEEHTWE